jgi:hypothetical protein
MLQARWCAIDHQFRTTVKAKVCRLNAVQQIHHLLLNLYCTFQLLGALNTADKTVGATVAQSISAIAQAELTRDLWPELIPALLQNATNAESPVHTKQNTLEAIGFICEEIVC